MVNNEPISYSQYMHDTDRLVAEMKNITALYVAATDELRKANARIAELEKRLANRSLQNGTGATVLVRKAEY